MREFYQQIIEDLPLYCGARAQMRDWSDEEIKKLLDILEKVSAVYAYIPHEEQKRIIEAQLLKDKEYLNINARLISKWLEENGKIFFKEVAHEETKEYEPATPEQRAQRLKEWEEAIAKTDNNFSVKPMSNAELMREKLHGKDAEPSGYKPDDELGKAKLVHMEYIKANYDAAGNCLETWLPEDEWINKNYHQ